MAHLDKFKANVINSLIKHNKRDIIDISVKEHIDPSLTHLNYTIGGDIGYKSWLELKKALETQNNGRKVRKDANALFSFCITLPKNIKPEHEDAFYNFCLDYVKDNVKSEYANVTGFVHCDEPKGRHHIHICGFPIIEENGNLILNYKKLFPRAFYKNLHPKLTDYCEQFLGYKPQILNDELDINKVLSKAGLSQKEFKMFKDIIKAEALEEKECLRQQLATSKRKETINIVNTINEEIQNDITETTSWVDWAKHRIEEIRTNMDSVIGELTNRLRWIIRNQKTCWEHAPNFDFGHGRDRTTRRNGAEIRKQAIDLANSQPVHKTNSKSGPVK